MVKKKFVTKIRKKGKKEVAFFFFKELVENCEGFSHEKSQDTQNIFYSLKHFLSFD